MAQILAQSWDTPDLVIGDYLLAAGDNATTPLSHEIVGSDSATTSNGSALLTLTSGGGRTGDKYLRVSNIFDNSRTSTYGTAGASQNNSYFQVAFRMITAPTAETTFVALSTAGASGGTLLVYCTLDSSGVVRLYDEDGQITGTISLLWSGGWNVLEIHVDTRSSPGAHVVQARLNTRLFATSSTRSLSANPGFFVLGGNLLQETSHALVIDYEDIIWNDASGSTANTWPGGAHVRQVAPTGPGLENDWTPHSSAGAGAPGTSNWTRAGDPTQVVNYVSSSTIDQADLYSFGNLQIPANCSIVSVTPTFRHSNPGSAFSDVAYRPYMQNSVTATVVRSTVDIFINSTTVATNATSSRASLTPPWSFYTDPDSHAWTPQVFAVSDFGMGITAASSTHAINIYGISVIVVYTDPNEFSRGFF